jgi:phosphate:Na+ symporter
MAKHIMFSEEASKELLSMFNYTVSALEMSIDCFKHYNKEKARTVRGVEERIDGLEKELRASHIRRLNTGICNATVGAIFLDVISNFERIGDHAVNVAEIISETPYKLN